MKYIKRLDTFLKVGTKGSKSTQNIHSYIAH